MRSNIASWRVDLNHGMAMLSAAPLPHRRADGAVHFQHVGDLLRRRRVVLTQFRNEACPQLGRVAIQVFPLGCHERQRAAEDQRPGSLRSFCREDDGGRAALKQSEEDGVSEADGVHDSLDLARSIIQHGYVRDRIRQPDPSFVEHEDATERGELVEEGLVSGRGPPQLDMADERRDEDELDRPVAKHLIRQAEATARCVRRFRHGMSVLLSSSRPPTSGAVACRWIEPLTTNRAAPEESRGGPIKYSDAD